MEIKVIFTVSLSKGSENAEDGLDVAFGSAFSSQRS